MVALFICALSKSQRALAGLAFADDTDLIVNDGSNSAKQFKQKNATIAHHVAWTPESNGSREMLLVPY